MTRKELNKMIEDEVAKILSEPLREPEIKVNTPVAVQKKPVNYKPALQTEEEIDEMLFGNKDFSKYHFHPEKLNKLKNK